MLRNRTPALTLCLVCCLPAGAWGASASPEPPADVDCKLVLGTGKLTVAGGPRGAVVDVAGANYQGGATLTFKKAPPAQLTFRFANLRGMNSFTFSDGKRTYTGSAPFTNMAGNTAMHWGRNGQLVNSPALAALSMVFEVKAAGGVEVRVSARDVELGKEVRVNWTQYLMKR
jgi:hypothetical protein